MAKVGQHGRHTGRRKLGSKKRRKLSTKYKHAKRKK